MLRRFFEKRGMEEEEIARRIDHLIAQLREHFGDAWVEGCESLIPTMTNEPKDRHVVAAAARSGSGVDCYV